MSTKNKRWSQRGVPVVCWMFVLACSGGQKGTSGSSTSEPVFVDAGQSERAVVDAAPSQEITPSVDAAVSQPAGPAVTFEIRNAHTSDLVLSPAAGWGTVVAVYSGKPPAAKSVLPFARPCTAACAAAESKRCPVCRKPKTLGQIRKQQQSQREIVKPGKSFELAWEGEVHVYQEARAARGRCECFEKQPIAEGVYTVRVCGLRLSTKHKKASKLQCVVKEDALIFPSHKPQKLLLDFGEP